jgi:hypothetical protein
VGLSATNVSRKEKKKKENEKCRRKETENNSGWSKVRKKLCTPGSGTRWTGQVGFRAALNAVKKKR